MPNVYKLGFQNGYKVIYEAKDETAEGTPIALYASKTIPHDNAIKCTIWKNIPSDTPVAYGDLKKVYEKSAVVAGGDTVTLLFGNTTPGNPVATDPPLTIKDATGKTVFGSPMVPEMYLASITCDTAGVEIAGEGVYGATDDVEIVITAPEGKMFAQTPKCDGEDMDMVSATQYTYCATMGRADHEYKITGATLVEYVE